MGKKFALTLSYLLHPAVFPLLGTLIMVELLPLYVPRNMVFVAMGVVLFGTYFLPLLLTLALYKMSIISSIHMKERHERKLPYLLTAICICLTAFVLEPTDVPIEVFVFLLASATVILLHLLMLYFFKPSAHMAGIAGFLGLVMSLGLRYQVNFMLFILLSIAFAGLLGTARLTLKAHTPAEILIGFTSGWLVVFGVFNWL